MVNALIDLDLTRQNSLIQRGEDRNFDLSFALYQRFCAKSMDVETFFDTILNLNLIKN